MQPFIGQIQPFGFNFNPRGWAKCDGQLLAISSNDALFSLLGTIYGGDGRTTFGLPELRGRSPIHFGSGPGLSPYAIGAKGGTENVTLNTLELPSHTHTLVDAKLSIPATNQEGDEDNPAGNVAAAHSGDEDYSTQPNTTMGATPLNGVNTGPTGGNQSHTNIQPYQVINWCIALVGIYPSRN